MSHQITVKTCKKCKEEKNVSFFSKDKNRKDGFQSNCKECAKAYYNANAETILAVKRSYYQKNHDEVLESKRIYAKLNAKKIAEKQKVYYQSNTEKLKEYKRAYNKENSEKVAKRQRSYYLSNIEKLKEYKRAYRKTNREKILAYLHDYRQKNKDKMREYRSVNCEKIAKYKQNYHQLNREKIADRQRNYAFKMFKEDHVFAIKVRIRNLIRGSLKRKSYKKTTRTHEILGCDYETFASHIESQFKDGMNWDNRAAWEIDHIIPLASAETEADVLRLNHYTNLQPLWAIDNRKKNDKAPSKHIQNKIALAYAKAIAA